MKSPSLCLPDDAGRARLVGRVRTLAGPHVVIVDRGELFDVTAHVPTTSMLLNVEQPCELFDRLPRDVPLGSVERVATRSVHGSRERDDAVLLAPCDLQAVKACGVTFVNSMLERIIEERARGDHGVANGLRARFEQTLGRSVGKVVPGSPEALDLKRQLIELGLWSQYLEVGIGPDAEVFTKAQPLSAVGFGHAVGILRESHWNNPEPEVVLAVSSSGRIVGATLGNDVNLRDYEGRSALLLGRAKDNNASCAVGPFIRLLDEGFTLADVGGLAVELEVRGTDGFVDRGVSSMVEISRRLEDLVAQTIGSHHQYPDGIVLFTGTMFTPTAARPGCDGAFSHRPGDVVRVRCNRLGTLHNVVDYADAIEPWTFGIGELMRNLAHRGLLPEGREHPRAHATTGKENRAR
jgi:fumarylacetoacetate (FAA) hydrolase family protein